MKSSTYIYKTLLFLSGIISDILRPLFESITEEEKMYGHFTQDSTASHTDTYPINVLNEVFEDRPRSRKQ
jgi:hypothetical protein